MTTKAISFLGYTRPDLPYRNATYCYGDQEYTTPFMAEATARFFQPDLLLVLVTPEARAQNFADLARRVDAHPPVVPVDIPSGKTEAELWTMFDAIDQHIAAGDTIIFDITNGFRSLPVLAFLAASFVRVVRGVSVAKMVYGAFDATVDGKTPVFDLTPFITLLDWTTATDAFLKFGRADDLARLVRSASAAGAAIGSPEALGPIADTVGTLTSALQTSRPVEVMRVTAGLEAQIKSARQASAATARPFGLLLDRIGAEYSGFGLADPMSPAMAREVVRKQLEMIEWYRAKGLFVQAMTLAREWLVSLVLAELGGDLFDKQQRGIAEKVINGQATAPAELAVRLASIRSVWVQLRDLRNDLAHTGMRANPHTAAMVTRKVADACAALPGLLE